MLTEHLLGRSWERDSASCWETRRCYGRILCLLRRTVTAGAVYPQVSVDRGSLRVVVCMLKVFEPRPARFQQCLSFPYLRDMVRPTPIRDSQAFADLVRLAKPGRLEAAVD